jgi:hypothetical protein
MLQAQQKFMDHWNTVYPETPPIGHQFKWRLPHRWMRIHSLPDSKRYPQNATEWTELLSRQNAVIDHVTRGARSIEIVITAIREDNPLFQDFTFENIGVFVDREAEVTFQSFVSICVWKKGCLDRVLRMIADAEVRGFIMARDCLISPYDGGMDLILKDSVTRDVCRERFKAWLSKREDGL